MKNKRFLITQPMIHGLNGSTMVALELAEFLISEGASVTVYTYYYDYPARHFFEKKHINVVSARDDDPSLRLKDFDYIWTHSQVLPIGIIDDLGNRVWKKRPIFLFNHMSPFDWIPDERPYIFELESRLATASLFVSEETKLGQARYYTADEISGALLFRNPAPKRFSTVRYEANKNLKRILIVSNHPPEELTEAKRILINQGYDVVSFGETSEEYGLITPELITQFDVVITIGKTVQYCLVAGVAVYVYDHYGGRGYLNANTYELAAKRNFSGREGKRESAQHIVTDIIGKYQQAVEYHKRNRNRFIREYAINNVLPGILSNLTPRAIDRFDSRYINAVKSAQIFAMIRFEEGARSQNNWRRAQELERQLEAAKEKIEELSSVVLAEREDKRTILESRAHRLGLVLVRPVGFIKNKIRR